MKTRPLSWLTVALAALTPAIITTLLLVRLGISLADLVPAYSDEIDYWLQISAFVNRGFGGGYFTMEEIRPPLPITPFGTHGPFFPMFYGLFGKMLGWQPSTGPYVNLLLLTGGATAYLAFVRPTWRRLLLFVAVLGTFWPMLLYAPIMMQESLHFSFALTLAGGFYALEKGEADRRRRLAAAVGVVIAAAALTKATWGVLYLPLILVVARGTARLWAFVVPPMLFVAGYLLMAPYPDSFLYQMGAVLRTSPAEAIRLLGDHASGNLGQLVDSAHGNKLEVAVRYQVIALAAVLLALFAFRKKERNWATAFQIFNLAAIATLTVLMYDVFDWRDFRLLAPPLLLTLALLVARGQVALAGAVVIANLALLPVFVPTYTDFRIPNIAAKASGVAAFANQSEPFLARDARGDAWEVTVMVPFDTYTFHILGLPPGYGVSLITDPGRVQAPIRSKYLLLGDRSFDMLRGKADLRPLVTTDGGKLYLNNAYPR